MKERYDRFKSLSPEDQDRLRQGVKRYQDLSPEKRRELRERWHQMTPEQREQMLEHRKHEGDDRKDKNGGQDDDRDDD